MSGDGNQKVNVVSEEEADPKATNTESLPENHNGHPSPGIIAQPEKETMAELVQDGDHNSIKKDTEISSNPEVSPFGPWMMVQRQTRIKNKSAPKKLGTVSQNNFGGSRFEALSEEKEENSLSNDTILDKNIPSIPNKNEVGPSSMQKHVNRVRNTMAGRNPQTKGTKSTSLSSSSKKQLLKPLTIKDKQPRVSETPSRESNMQNTTDSGA
ncbi:hypothetical protein RIF29_14520 [Crotalaria pallida]|uniref:Uncharacterized protein n=1 Tax=Crotalaria pallida TaxID=3830 RepID=A0AAN9FDJ6_CROPI